MALEDEIKALTAAVKENTAALGGAAAPKAGGAGRPAGSTVANGAKPKATAKPKAKHTAEEVKAILVRVKEEVGQDTAKEIISETGESDKLATLLTKPDMFDAVYAAAEAVLEGEGGEAEAEDDGL